jgi:AcrR family transcriptional regulator
MITRTAEPLPHAPPEPFEPEDRPLRRDAERNRRRILDAAEELFAERGLSVTLNEIAHHAGVGVGTVYRRFPDKAKLIDGLFERHLEELVELMEQAVADPDPWAGLTHFLEGSLASQACNSALKDLVLSTPEGLEHVARVKARLYPLGERLLRRAQESGQLRGDIQAVDLAIVQMMVGSVIDCARAVDDQLWRRYLEIVLQGLRAHPSPPQTLGHPAPPADRLEAVMAAGRRGRR